MAAEYINLPGGTRMPMVGLGTWQVKGQQLKQVVEQALDCGYRHFDTAYMYHNEDVLGDVLQQQIQTGNLKREDIFITTKLSPIHMGSREIIRQAFEASLSKLQLEYLDLYLIHSPVACKFREDGDVFHLDDDGNIDIDTPDLVEVWKALEELVDEGKTRAIGVSNFNSKQIAQIQKEARHPIATNQVECHIYFQQDQLVEFCMERGITVTAFAPFGSPGVRFKDGGAPLSDEAVKKIAAKHKKTPAQVLVRWLTQRGIAVIPKSATPARIQENIQVFDFELNANDMAALQKLNKNKRVFDGRNIGLDRHPYYPWNETY